MRPKRPNSDASDANFWLHRNRKATEQPEGGIFDFTASISGQFSQDSHKRDIFRAQNQAVFCDFSSRGKPAWRELLALLESVLLRCWKLLLLWLKHARNKGNSSNLVVQATSKRIPATIPALAKAA